MKTLSAISLFSLLLTLTLTASLTAAAASTAYDVLRSHGLPPGLLPKGVRDFHVADDGRFEARLDNPCTAKFETEVQYSTNISGTISYGEIAALDGVSAQELFLWFPVHGIRVDVPSSGLIYFDVGVIHKQFSLSLFDSPLECKPVIAATSLEGSHLARLVDQVSPLALHLPQI